MKLNKPFWAVMTEDSSAIIWDYESPLLAETRKGALEKRAEAVRMASNGGWCGRTAEQWKKMEIKKVVLKSV